MTKVLNQLLSDTLRDTPGWECALRAQQQQVQEPEQAQSSINH